MVTRTKAPTCTQLTCELRDLLQGDKLKPLFTDSSSEEEMLRLEASLEAVLKMVRDSRQNSSRAYLP